MHYNAHTYTYRMICSLIYANIHTCMHTTHTCKYIQNAHTNIHAWITYTHIHTYIYVYTDICLLIYANVHTCINKIHKCKHIHSTHICIHKSQIYIYIYMHMREHIFLIDANIHTYIQT
jgi:hypothetical protein